MDDIIRVKDQFYVLATSSLIEDRTRVLKYGHTFAVFDPRGDIEPIGLGQQGLYHRESRHLSRLVLRLDKRRPLLLNSAIRNENTLLAIDMTNLDVSENGQVKVPRGTLHLFRSKFLWQGACYDTLRISSFSQRMLAITVSLEFGADFADIFEVRGMKRERRGKRLEDRFEDDSLILSYEGLDGVLRQTHLEYSPQPKHVSAGNLEFSLSLEPREETTLHFKISCHHGNQVQRAVSYRRARGQLENALEAAKVHQCRISSSNKRFDELLARSEADLHMMVAGNPEGAYPYAGVPWFNTVFGRDGIITALECLWMAPQLAKGVLEFLAATQATAIDREKDAEPGKILHEMRTGEMAVLKEVPFGCYYGSIDATPLFVLLAGAYYQRTGDAQLIHAIWNHIELALRWIDKYGDADGDGFVEYSRRSRKGLIQQGWKDSFDSVFHADGSLAEPPIALCEVQGYVYAAKQAAATLASAVGHSEKAKALRKQAKTLQTQFEKAFWCDDLESYALALDGHKKPCRVRTSNAGHCLFTGIAGQKHAAVLSKTLLGKDMFSGWGVRTVSAKEARYNPISYHNGSVWPHDNALIAYGLSRYGWPGRATAIFSGLFDASLHVDLQRLPELFCGIHRRPGDGPTAYPVACAPQSWAAAAPFLLLEAFLGISIEGGASKIGFKAPALPDFLEHVRIEHLRVGESSLDFLMQRQGTEITIEVLRQEGAIDVQVLDLRGSGSPT